MLLRKYESIEVTDNGYLIHGDVAAVLLVFMTDDIIRIRVHFDSRTPMKEESYTLVMTAWPIASLGDMRIRRNFLSRWPVFSPKPKK